MSKTKVVQIIFIILALGAIAFIFSNSMQPAVTSEIRSRGVLSELQGLLHRMGINARLTDHIVRKSGHFIEYFLFGILLFCVFIIVGNKSKGALCVVIGVGILVPIIDENIQRFFPGRSCLASDAILDMTGIAVGMLISWLVYFLICRCRRRYSRKRSFKGI